MPSNNTKGLVHYLAGKYEGQIGLLISPDGWRTPPYYMPYALDNGAFTGFDETAFIELLHRAEFVHPPMWVVVPDVVGDSKATSKLWHEWVDRVKYRKAFAAQDGHTPGDVPKNADAVFVGGTTDWKLANAHRFKGVTPWLHIGRVNTLKRLYWAERIGADSVDGTGYFRGGKETERILTYYLGGDKQECLQY